MSGTSEEKPALVEPASGASIAPKKQPGYYPGFSTLAQQNFWDEKTRRVVLDRVNRTPPMRFFTSEESVLMNAVCKRIMPQDDREGQFKIPIANRIDARLFENRIEGYRFEDMPSDQDAHRLGLQAIEQIAKHLYGKSFVDLIVREQETILKSIHDAQAPAGEAIWKRMSISRYWMLLVQDCVDAYYAHPWAWDEIGFGGPAYPRAYMRLERGEAEPWEVEEQRYEWMAPSDSVSDVYEQIGGAEDHGSHPGQGGTH